MIAEAEVSVAEFRRMESLRLALRVSIQGASAPSIVKLAETFEEYLRGQTTGGPRLVVNTDVNK